MVNGRQNDPVGPARKLHPFIGILAIINRKEVLILGMRKGGCLIRDVGHVGWKVWAIGEVDSGEGGGVVDLGQT